MATSVTLNAVSYSIPAVGESNWGTNVSSYLVALSTGVLQKAGGSFTLTADVDFGANYGLKSIYYKSRGTVSSVGVLRLANAEYIGWRNAANGADKLLRVNSSDLLEFAGNPIVTLALGSADTVLRMNSGGTAYEFSKLSDANIASAAAIAVDKLAALTASRAVVSDGSGFLASATTTATEIGYVNGVTSAIQTQLDTKAIGVASAIDSEVALFSSTGGKQLKRATGTGVAHLTSGVLSASAVVLTSEVSGVLPIANGGTNSSTSLNNNRVMQSSGGAIVEAAAITASRALASDSNGIPVASSTTATEVGYVNGVTSAIQTQLDAKLDETAGTVTSGSYIRFQGQAAARFEDDSGGDYIALQAPTGVTTHTLKLPPTQGAASTTLNNDGSGNLTWVSGVSAGLNEFYTDIGNSSNTRTATNTNLLGNIKGSTQSSTVTITIAAPGVVSYTSHGLSTGNKVYITTTGALPTGLSVSTTYYVVAVDANSFSLATSLANAVAGTKITTTGSQSGTHTLFAGGLRFLSEDARIPGKTSGNNDTAGYVGEMLNSTVTSAVASGVTAGQFGNVTSLTLTPGHWLVYSTIQNTRVASQNELTVAISAFSGNTTTDHVPGKTEMTLTMPTVGAGNMVVTLVPFDQSLNASTTVYLKAKLDGGTWTQANFSGTIFATRTT